MRLLLRSSSGEHHRGAGLAEQVRRPFHFALRYPGDPLHSLRPIGGDGPLDMIEAFRPRVDVVLVDQAVAHQSVEHPVGQRGVRSRRQAQVQVRATERLPRSRQFLFRARSRISPPLRR